MVDYPQFFTATCLEWKHLLKEDACKSIIVSSLKFLADKKRATIYAFVVMPNHIHLIWQMHKGHERSKVQQSFMKFTAQEIKRHLQIHNPQVLQECCVAAADREYQIWERNPLSIDLFTEPVFMQKLDYLHNNPTRDKWKLAAQPEDYRWSSAGFYIAGTNKFDFIRHYTDGCAEFD